MIVGGTGGQLGLVSSDDRHTASMTAGLVQEYNHRVLPSIRPLHTLVFTVMAAVVCFYLQQGSYVLVSVCLSVCLLATSHTTTDVKLLPEMCGRGRSG